MKKEIHNFFFNFVTVNMTRCHFRVWRGSELRGFRSCGRVLVDELIASLVNEHASTLPLGDDLEEPCADVTDEASSFWQP